MTDSHPTSSISIRRASAADAAALSALAAETFRDAFGAQNTADDMALHLANSYSPAKQATEIADQANTILLAAAQDATGDSRLVGYAHVAQGPAPADVRSAAPIELKRFYVARAWHGSGVARRLFEAVETEARRRAADALWLGVWQKNPRAIAFYEKSGFRIVGVQTFVVGTDAQDDWVMVRPIAS